MLLRIGACTSYAGPLCAGEAGFHQIDHAHSPKRHMIILRSRNGCFTT